jgi:hypothetical protein
MTERDPLGGWLEPDERLLEVVAATELDLTKGDEGHLALTDRRAIFFMPGESVPAITFYYREVHEVKRSKGPERGLKIARVRIRSGQQYAFVSDPQTTKTLKKRARG